MEYFRDYPEGRPAHGRTERKNGDRSRPASRSPRPGTDWIPASRELEERRIRQRGGPRPVPEYPYQGAVGPANRALLLVLGLLVADLLDRVGVVALARDLHLLDLVAAPEAIDHVLPLQHAPEHGVLSVQPLRRQVGDEELRAVRVGARVGHRDRAAEVTAISLGNLVLETVAGVAASVAERAAALGHEARQHSVELQAVVELLRHQLDEVGDRVRRLVLEELKLEVALRGGDRHAREIIRLLFL